VLVTGDSDFSPLVSKLREFGKHVIGVGAETAASARLVSVCSEYKLGLDRRQGRPAGRDRAASRPAGVPARGRRGAAGGRDAVDHRGHPAASQVKAKMVALNPSFNEANYGCRSFRDFLAQLDHRVRTAGRSGGAGSNQPENNDSVDLGCEVSRVSTDRVPGPRTAPGVGTIRPERSPQPEGAILAQARGRGLPRGRH